MHSLPHVQHQESMHSLRRAMQSGRNCNALTAATAACCCLCVPACCALQPPAVLSERHKRVPMHIICDYVLVLALLALGGAMQWATTVRTLQNVSDPRAPAPQRDLESSGADVQVSVALAVRPEQQQQQQDGRSGCFGGSGSRQDAGVQPGGSAV